MSLGFNFMRQPRTTNLPGAVGSNVIVASRKPVSLARSLNSVTSGVVKAATRNSSSKTSPPRATIPKRDDDVPHGVYATVRGDLCDAATEEVVCNDGTRVYMVYPMKMEGDKVVMRLKSAHPDTGQLTYRWVVVYDPASNMERHLHRFSLIP